MQNLKVSMIHIWFLNRIQYTMNLSLNELTKMATQEVNFDETFFTNIEECIKYNSIGTLNWAIHTLTIIRERIVPLDR